MTRIYIPSESPEDWKKFLADPEKHWKAGHSAFGLAYTWEDAKGFPGSIRSVFQQNELLCGAELLVAIPEHKVPLPGGARPSQTDVWVLARLDAGLISIAVEGKVAEPFGRSVGQWLSGASAGKRERLDYLVSLLALDGRDLDSLRYQLFHRTASAIIEAHRFHAQYAMMMVHSFSQDDKWFADYKEFVARFGVQAKVNAVSSAGETSGVELFFAWVKGDEKYLIGQD